MQYLPSSSYEPVVTIHCLTAQDFGASVEQPFSCFITQNRQALQSMAKSMDWTLEDDMVDGLFFCATLTGRRRGHTPFLQAGAETSDTGVEAAKPDQRCSWNDHSRCVPVLGMKVRSLVVLSNYSVFHRWSAQSAALLLLSSHELMSCCSLRRVQTDVSICDAVHSHSMVRWALSEADVQAPGHGVPKTVWFLCDETQQVGRLRG